MVEMEYCPRVMAACRVAAAAADADIVGERPTLRMEELLLMRGGGTIGPEVLMDGAVDTAVGRESMLLEEATVDRPIFRVAPPGSGMLMGPDGDSAFLDPGCFAGVPCWLSLCLLG